MIKICSYRIDGHRARVVLAGLALSALASAPALAQQNQPFTSVNFAVPVAAAADSVAADPQAAAPAPPANPDAGFLNFFRSTELGGLADVYYDWFSTKPSGNAPLRNFDTKHNQFSFTMAEVWLAKTPTADSRTGFKVKFNFGPAVEEFIHNNSDHAVIGPVEEAFVSYLAPAGKGLQFDVGIFVTQHGAEVIEAKDNWNYSRSILFAWAIPYYHSGIRVTYPASDKVTLMGDLVNGWNNVADNNTGKTVGGQVTLKPTSAVSVVGNYMGGPEQAGNNDDWRHLFDVTASCTVTPVLSVMANYDYGRDKVVGSDVHWQGIAGYAKYQATPIVAVVPRVEFYDDANGSTTGTAQKLKEATITLELKPTSNFMWRIEYRGDFSDVPVFTTDTGSAKKNQQSVAFGFLYNFSTKQ